MMADTRSGVVLLVAGGLALALGAAVWHGWPADPGGTGAGPVGAPVGDPVAEYVPRKDRPGEAADFFLAQRVGPGEELPVERYEAAMRASAGMARIGRAPAKLGRSAWEPVGPGGVGGRTRALLIDPEDPQRMFAGGVSGGVWRSTDGGAHWHGAGQHAFTNLAVASLALHPQDGQVLFAGTGEGVYVGRPVTRSRGVRGNGIFVSRDGGSTWRHLPATRGVPEFDYVNRLVFDTAGRLHAATRAGLFVSADEGETWTQGLAPPNAEGCSELVHVPGPDRMVASCGVFSQSALYASDDGGASWRTIALPSGAGRTTLAVAPSQPAVVYALSAHHLDYGFLALLRSDDGGASWQLVRSRATADPLSLLVLSNPYAAVDERCERVLPGVGIAQGWFDNVIAVDPVDPEVLYVGGVDLFRSDDGGGSFRLMSRWWVDPALPSYAHADQHAIVFDPRYDGTTHTRMFVANDGGVYMTEDPRGTLSSDICAEDGTPAWQARNEGYLVTQFYDGVVSEDGARLIGGTQDNGTQLGHSLDEPWREVFGGDGGYAALDPRDPDRYYVSTPYAGFVRTDDDMASFEPLYQGLPGGIAGYLFIHPLLLDPNAPDVLWTGAGATVYRSDDRGDSWSPTSAGPVHAAGTGIVSALAVAEGNGGHVVVGLDNGVLARSVDAGASWMASQPRQGFVSSVTIDASDHQRVYATYATFGGAHVYASADGGASWAALEGSGAFALPDVPAHTVAIDPDDSRRLWLGTDIGLFVSPDRGGHWYADGSGLGHVLIEALRVSGGEEPALVAFTYGRGAWRAPLSALQGVPFNPGLAGAWYDPATPGQGFFFETVPGADVMTAAWYTWGQGGGANHVWLSGSGAVAEGRATIDLFHVPSGRFAAQGAAAAQPVGSLVVDFADCARASAEYAFQHPELGTREGRIDLLRLTSAAWCEAFRAHGDAAVGELAGAQQAGDIEYGHGGSWVAAGAASQGFMFEFDPGTGLAAGSWYTYDPLVPAGAAQRPTWYSALGAVDGPQATLSLMRTTGGAFGAGAPVQTEEVGTLTLVAAGCGAMTAEYTLRLADGSSRSGTFALSRVTPATVCEQMAP